MDAERNGECQLNGSSSLDFNVDDDENEISKLPEEHRWNNACGASNTNTDSKSTPMYGMTFKTVDEAYQVYKCYAFRVGFGITKVCSRRKDGAQNEYTFACEKQGKPKIRTDQKFKRARTSKRIGCQAKFRVRLKEDGLWHLVYMILEHNHYCSPSESLNCRSHKNMLSPMLSHVEKPLLEKNCTKHIDNASCLKLEQGDAEVILDYFHRMQRKNPLFFHLMDLNGEGRLRHVFWADARSRASYAYFNDVILFDTTHLTNENGILLASFSGVNHHGSSVFFGAVLLADERVETYAWLFKAWLTCMGNVAPKAIITDHCHHIASAVFEVFPNSQHRLCIWQIMKKVPEKLTGYPNYEEIKARLEDVVYDSLKVEEFEQNWTNMIEEFDLGDNEWLVSLYEVRKYWVPVFVKDAFWAGISSIKRSENRNAYLNSCLTSTSSLKQFIMAYENALQAKYESEFVEEFECKDKNPHLISSWSVEEHLSKLYTLSMFHKFQEELQKCVDCTCNLFRKDGAVSTYQVKERVKERAYVLEVLFNEDEVEVQCLCNGFEFSGILCSHSIVVLKENDIQKIPARYICDRWKKTFKQDYHVPLSSSHDVPRLGKRFDRLYLQCLQHLSRLVELGASSNDRYEHLLKLLAEAKRKLSKIGKNQTREGQEKASQNVLTSKLGQPDASQSSISGNNLPNSVVCLPSFGEMGAQEILLFYMVPPGIPLVFGSPSCTLLPNLPFYTTENVAGCGSQWSIIFPHEPDQAWRELPGKMIERKGIYSYQVWEASDDSDHDHHRHPSSNL